MVRRTYSNHPQALARQMKRVIDQVRHSPSPEAVHRLRTTTRRWEALHHRILGEEADKPLRPFAKVRKLAGRVRDADVQEAALRSVRMGRNGNMRKAVLEYLHDRRTQQSEKLISFLDDSFYAKLRRRLKKMEARLSEADTAGPDPSVAMAHARELLREIAADYGFPEAGEIDDERLHQLRLRCKRIRYTAEQAGEYPEALLWVAELRRVQDAIGEWHDWLDLTATVRKVLKDNFNRPLIFALENVMRAKRHTAIATASEVLASLLDGAGKKPARSGARAPRETLKSA